MAANVGPSQEKIIFRPQEEKKKSDEIKVEKTATNSLRDAENEHPMSNDYYRKFYSNYERDVTYPSGLKVETPFHLIPSSSPDSSNWEETKCKATFFAQLEKSIKMVLKIDPHIAGNKPISLARMFLEIDAIFKSLVADKPQSTEENYCLVSGDNGAGKSALIGYLLEHELKKQEVPGGRFGRKRTILDYSSECKEESASRPVIKHGSSKTKEFSVYGNYIDTAGVSCTSSFEEEVCNTVAAQIAINNFPPRKVIFVLPSSNLSSTRGHYFLELIERIGLVIPDPTNPMSWSHILLAINDRGGKTTKDSILDHIYEAIDLLKEERNKIISKDPRYKKLIESSSWKNEEFIELFKELKKTEDYSSNITMVGHYQGKIEILEALLLASEKNEDNIEIVDFENPKCRDNIRKWIELPYDEHLLGEKIRMDRMVPNSFDIVKNTILLTKTYFNILIEQSKEFEKQIEELSNLIKASCRDTDSLENELNEQTKKSYEELKILEKEINQLKEKRRILEANQEKEIALQDLQPINYIKSRPLWAIDDTEANGFLFEISEEAPITRCEFRYGSEENKGSFKGDESTFLEERKILYIPDWGGHKSNCETVIRLFVKAKDHPKTKTQIYELESLLEIKEKRFNGINKRLHLEKKNLLQWIEAKEAVEKSKKSIDAKLHFSEDFRELLSRVFKKIEEIE